jgi:hypothetical protein
LPTFYAGAIDEVRIPNIARHEPPTVSDTVALWHYDETTGNNVLDSSPYGNDGTAVGTTIVPGILGNARYFNGSSDYVNVFSSPIFNMDVDQSFTIDLWCKTVSTHDGWLIRRGLAPTPGFSLGISGSRLLGEVGNRVDGTAPDTLLMLFSERSHVDGLWHHVTFVRDRSVHNLFLYVDGVLAASPMPDNFPIPLTYDRPLTMGRWETLPEYFGGYLDEVPIFKGARHPVNIGLPNIQVSPSELQFGNVLFGGTITRDIGVSNTSFSDTLNVANVTSNNSVFTANVSTFFLPPGSSRNVQVTYRPSIVGKDTCSLSIASNDPNKPIVRVYLAGQGFTAAAAPLILSITDIPEDQGKQVRVIWYRSLHDSLGDLLRVVQYNLWRRVGQDSSLWDFVATIPAVQFEQYAYVAPTLFDSSRAFGIRWSVFKVSAQTALEVSSRRLIAAIRSIIPRDRHQEILLEVSLPGMLVLVGMHRRTTTLQSTPCIVLQRPTSRFHLGTRSVPQIPLNS